jgi:hypothetical protein
MHHSHVVRPLEPNEPTIDPIGFIEVSLKKNYEPTINLANSNE